MKRIFVYEFVSAGGLAADPATEATLLPLGTAMRDAMAGDLLALPDVECVTVAASDHAPWRHGRDPRLQLHAPSGDPIEDIAAQARRHDGTWLVAPETGGLLAACQRAVGDAHWLGCSAAAIALASSKSQTLARLRARGIPTPMDWLSPPLNGEVSRWIVKPDDGAGAVATEVFDDAAAARTEATSRIAAGEHIALQPFVEGRPMSLSLWATGGRAELLSVNAQRIRIDDARCVHFDGIDRLDWTPADARWQHLQDLARRLALAVPGLRGYVSVDLVWHDARGPVVIELNPRVSVAYVGLSQRLGCNLAGALLSGAGVSLPATDVQHHPERAHA